MLDPATLNRVSNSYRRGYYDGYDIKIAQNNPVETFNGVPMKPFSDFDYSEGHKAGMNDRYWNDFHGGRTKMSRVEFFSQPLNPPIT